MSEESEFTLHLPEFDGLDHAKEPFSKLSIAYTCGGDFREKNPNVFLTDRGARSFRGFRLRNQMERKQYVYKNGNQLRQRNKLTSDKKFRNSHSAAGSP